jgi:hypothetical protein
MSRLRYCHGGAVGDGLCLTGDVTTNEVATCDMGSCCDFDWSGWTGCCRNTANQNVRLRFRGGCEGTTQPQEVSKPCDVSGMVAQDSCLVVIQNSLELGIIGTGYNMTYVINPDEYVNFQNQILQGQTLGHEDRAATSHSLNVVNTMWSSTDWSFTDPSAPQINEFGWSSADLAAATHQSSSFQMMFDGHWIHGDQLDTNYIDGRIVQGKIINGHFVEGRFVTKFDSNQQSVYQFVAGRNLGSNGFEEGKYDDQDIFIPGEWRQGIFYPDE